MKAALYAPFDDPWRQSMRVYAGELTAALARLSEPDLALTSIALPGAHLDPPMRYWDQYVRYQRLAARTRADVHHVLDHGFAHLAGAVPARRAVVVFHDAMPFRSGSASRQTRMMLAYGMRRAVARGARFVTVSKASLQDARQLFDVPAGAIDVVPPGVSDRFAPAADREALRARLGVRRPVVLLVGHTQAYMNVDGALRAAGLAARDVDLDVVKIGAPLTVEQGRVADAEGLAGRLRERGIVGEDELRDWYAAADVLLYLPLMSGFGLPVLEAMASATPVVASSLGAVPELAEGAAALVDPREPRAAASALTEILTSAGRRDDLIARGLARAAEYPWSRTAAATLRVYREVADGA